MIQKGFLRTNSRMNSKELHNVSLASKTLFIVGVLTSFFALCYMLLNIEKADSIISLWLPFMIAGIVIIYLSQLIKLIGTKKHR
jgi:hypothetical protein